MTNYEKYFKNAKTVAKLIIEGISSDVCDYCNCNEEICNGVSCHNMEDTEIIEMWLEREAEEWRLKKYLE